VINALGTPQRLLLLGGTSDIALAITREYAAERPPAVVLAARPSQRRTEAAEDLRAVGCEVRELDLDARDPHTHADVVRAAAQDGDIDIAVVAFGVLGDAERAWTDVDAALEMVETNYVGAVSCGVAMAGQIKRQGHGVVVAMSSVAGERPRRSNFVYGSTKAGLDAFYTGSVLVVRPGFVRSKMTDGIATAPLSVTPEEVAKAVVAGVRRGAEQIWVPTPMRAVMSGLRHLPRPVFRRLPI
jgi:decaprenylphospho-beta-D-erythro-pentofuranosid-2-ulose 2-reductase